MRSRRHIRGGLFAVVAMAALGSAGVGGARLVGNTRPIERGQWAHLEGTKIYCEAFYQKQYDAMGFDCGTWVGSHRAPNSYSFVIDELGVEIDRWDAKGRTYDEVKTYLNR